MPRIDDKIVAATIFKKKEYRSWDSDLLNSLTITDSKPKAQAQATYKSSTPEKSLDTHQPTISSEKPSIPLNSESREPDRVTHNQGAELGCNRVQQGAELGCSFDIKNLQKLKGNDKNLFFFILQLCIDNDSLSSGFIPGEDIDHAIPLTRNSRESSIKRLKKKGLLLREQGKPGARGMVCLGIPEPVKTEAIKYLTASNKGSLININQGAELGCISGYSSSYNKTTTNNKNSLPPEWQDIDFEELKHIRFSTTQIKQLVDKNEPELVQESIYHFAYGLEHNQKTKQYAADKKALNVLMGVLRKGQGWTEPGYISPKERAMQEQLERRKAELARIKQVEDELFSVEFDAWLLKQDEETLDSLIPANARKHASMRQSALRLHFKANFWQEIQKGLK